MLACTAFSKEFYVNISKSSNLCSYCRLTYKMEEGKHEWKSGYNFVHTVNLQNFISYCEYPGRYLWRISLGILVNFVDSLLCKRLFKKEASMMMLERRSNCFAFILQKVIYKAPKTLKYKLKVKSIRSCGYYFHQESDLNKE